MTEVSTLLLVITLNINRGKSPVKIQISVERKKTAAMAQARDAYKRLTLNQKLPRDGSERMGKILQANSNQGRAGVALLTPGKVSLVSQSVRTELQRSVSY